MTVTVERQQSHGQKKNYDMYVSNLKSAAYTW